MEKFELLEKARENYQNAILFAQAGKRDDFYRYLGMGEATEYLLRCEFPLTEEEEEQLTALTDICDDKDDSTDFKFKWIENAVKNIRDGIADKLESKRFNTIVYRCGLIIRIDIK